MSDLRIYRFLGANGRYVGALLPADPSEMLKSWDAVRRAMRKEICSEFERTEWAYLAQFLSTSNLSAPFERCFGVFEREGVRPLATVFRPKGTIAIWLPNNVSLLGPLSLILLSLTGNALRLKTASKANDLATAFLDFAIRKMPEGPYRAWLTGATGVVSGRHDDSSVRRLAESAQVRVVFGSDEAAESIHRMGSVSRSVSISFVDRYSEAWVAPQGLTDDALRKVAQSFMIYGNSGCTSPRTLRLLDADRKTALAARETMVENWATWFRKELPPADASANFLAAQLAGMDGLDINLAPRNGAVLSVGPAPPARLYGIRMLSIVYGPAEEAVAGLSHGIQTIGYEGGPQSISDSLAAKLVAAGVVRIVPVSEMHHFESIWDGEDFWLRCFERCEIRA